MTTQIENLDDIAERINACTNQDEKQSLVRYYVNCQYLSEIDRRLILQLYYKYV